MRILLRLLRYVLYLALAGALAGALAIGTAYWLIAPRLPSVETLKDVRLQVPLRIYSADDKLVAAFGETKRTPVRIEVRFLPEHEAEEVQPRDVLADHHQDHGERHGEHQPHGSPDPSPE